MYTVTASKSNSRKMNKYRKSIMVHRAIVLFALVALAFIFIPKNAISVVPEKLVTYTVRPGDTLWHYAATITPSGGNVSDSVDRLMKINHLDSSDISVGQTINVPVVNM